MAKRKGSPGAQLGLDGVGFEVLTEAETSRKGAEIRQLDPRKLLPNAGQPRHQFDPERLMELAESFRAVGVLQPLLARERSDGAVELIAGERRQRAAILAGLERVPVRVLAISDATAAAITLTENLARDDLTPWEEALGLARLKEALAEAGTVRTRDELARMVGRSNGAVSESLQIAERLAPLLPVGEIDGQTLTKLPKVALSAASRGRTAEERARLLRLALAKFERRESTGAPLLAAARKGRPAKGWTVSDRLRDRGTLSFRLRKRPEELAPDEARDALARLMPLIEALRARTEPPPPDNLG